MAALTLSRTQPLNDHITHIKFLTGMLKKLMQVDTWKEFDEEKLFDAKTLTDNIILNAILLEQTLMSVLIKLKSCN